MVSAQKYFFKNHSFALCLGFAGLLAFSSCSTKDTNDVAQAGKNVAKEPGLQGKWSTACGSAGAFDASGKSTYIFEPLKYEKSLNLYKDSSCNETLAIARYEGEFKVGSGDDLADGVKRVDLTPKKLILKANSEGGVKAMNLIKLCGISDWALNTERDVTAGAVDGKCLSEPINQVQYDVYKLADNKLSFGKTFITGAPNKEEQRPTKVSDQVLVPAQ